MSEKRDQVRSRQKQKQKKFAEHPDAAMVTDRARATGDAPDDPFHGEVLPDKATEGPWKYGIHEKVGGLHDAPTSGDILCAALATCLESTIRLIAGRLDVEIVEMEVDVTAEVDVRGALLVDPDVPVGFQNFYCDCRLAAADETEPEMVSRIAQVAEYSCIVLQTLKQGVPVETSFDLEPRSSV